MFHPCGIARRSPPLSTLHNHVDASTNRFVPAVGGDSDIIPAPWCENSVQSNVMRRQLLTFTRRFGSPVRELILLIPLFLHFSLVDNRPKSTQTITQSGDGLVHHHAEVAAVSVGVLDENFAGMVHSLISALEKDFWQGVDGGGCRSASASWQVGLDVQIAAG